MTLPVHELRLQEALLEVQDDPERHARIRELRREMELEVDEERPRSALIGG
jgi:hypothetical protein